MCGKIFLQVAALLKLAWISIRIIYIGVLKGVLRNFEKFTGKQLLQGLFLNKVAGLRPATLLKRRLWPKACNFIKKETLAQVFSYEFCEISKNTLSAEHLRAIASVICNNFTINSAQFGRITYWLKLSQDKKVAKSWISGA